MIERHALLKIRNNAENNGGIEAFADEVISLRVHQVIETLFPGQLLLLLHACLEPLPEPSPE